MNANAAVFNEERESLVKQLKEKEKLLQEKQEKLHELEREKEELSKRIAELTNEVKKANESQRQNECQKKCEGFYKQVMSLNAKLLESEKEISTLIRSNENLRAQVSEKEAMIIMIRDQVSLFRIY